MRAARSLALAISVAVLGAMLATAPAGADSTPGMVVRGHDNGAKNDRVVARLINLYAGETAQLFRKEGDRLVLIREKQLNDKGNARFRVTDHNGKRRTKYVVKVFPANEELHRGRGARKIR